MKEVRKKKIMHALKIHSEGRVFVENCLVERGNGDKKDPKTNTNKQDTESRCESLRASARKECTENRSEGLREKEGNSVEKSSVETQNRNNDKATPREVQGTGAGTTVT